jgi:hypothetical protein
MLLVPHERDVFFNSLVAGGVPFFSIITLGCFLDSQASGDTGTNIAALCLV